MLQAVEAIVNPDGSVKLLEQLKVKRPTSVIMTLVPDDSAATLTQDDYISGESKGCNAGSLLAWLKSPKYQNRPYVTLMRWNVPFMKTAMPRVMSELANQNNHPCHKSSEYLYHRIVSA